MNNITLNNDVLQTELIELHVTIDDMTNEEIAPMIDETLALGANDAWLIPIIMKKGRPGFLFCVLTEKTLISNLLDYIFTQTSSLGLRMIPVQRFSCPRMHQRIETQYGSIRIKIKYYNRAFIDYKIEYEDLYAIHRRTGLSIQFLRKELHKDVILKCIDN